MFELNQIRRKQPDIFRLWGILQGISYGVFKNVNYKKDQKTKLKEVESI